MFRGQFRSAGVPPKLVTRLHWDSPETKRVKQKDAPSSIASQHVMFFVSPHVNYKHENITDKGILHVMFDKTNHTMKCEGVAPAIKESVSSERAPSM